MMQLRDLTAKVRVTAACAVVLTALIWLVISRATQRSPDDPVELLKRTTIETGAAPALKTLREKAVVVVGKSSSGAALPVTVTPVQTASGRTAGVVAGFRELKEGETASISIPGRGKVVISSPRPAGGTSKWTGTPAKK